MARCHGTTKLPPPHARLHREYNAAARHGTRKHVGEISMLHQRKEHNGDRTRITRQDKEGKEQGASMLPCRATPRTRVKQRVPGPRHHPRPEKKDGFRPGSGCHGGLTVLPCGAMRGNRGNCSYSTTTLFVALIRSYTLVHSVVSGCFVKTLGLGQSCIPPAQVKTR